MAIPTIPYELKVEKREYNGHKGVDIRYFANSDNYQGPTKKGIWIPEARWQELKDKVNAVEV